MNDEPFWARARIPSSLDIAILRPATRPKRERFETESDARQLSEKTAKILGRSKDRTLRYQATQLGECSDAEYVCGLTICHVCARQFRRWLIAQQLKVHACYMATEIATVFLASAPEGQLSELNIDRGHARLRKILQRLNLRGAVIIGGTEANYQARHRRWILHVHVLAIGVPRHVWDALEDRLASESDAPVTVDPINDPPRQLSYLQKFVTYHRPGARRGRKRARAYPLPPARLKELAGWLDGVAFEDCLFLFGATRRGATITPLIDPGA